MEVGKLEYRVRPITRYVVTRYEETVGGRTGGSSQCGEYDNADIAHEVAYALCKQEHDRLGFPLGDERIQYPKKGPPNLGRP
jgi:hypothetical protein